MLAKTAQKHDYPSAAWRRSYARRTGAERGFATAKDPASNDIARGWCRLMGLAPLMLFTAALLVVRNQRILAAWNARQEEDQRRAAAGLPPKPANGAARPSPGSPPGHPDPQPPPPRAPRPSPPARTATSRREHALTQGKPADQAPAHARRPRHRTTGYQEAGMSDPNVKIALTET